ncbi:Alcohol dehydrogenase zinc-binding domain protein [Kribbella flavida DSM 17836]|uniref:Alcohol dehydrogenase zinc-binding domain protein n=1 Tax=Kribbella flavida (strain DSM 17836 / JCM 10339 / NBRC 14399) TaxID=479435 RepID=D2PNT4_KRIFD|nr:zinc-binding dehydrogenase [Kribbella flavida]ADB32752.1 Alcohol dehydrogenase zinc-binding domain protein [Kribbella flavida DSM 17836]
MRAVQITEFGGPEVLRVSEVDAPQVGRGQVLITVDRAGINYADTHQVENSYLSKTELPLIPGGEVVGRTADGRRVVALLGSGGYAEQAVAHAPYAFDVPDGVSDGDALALVLQGTTAWHLLKTSTHLQEGESVLVHAGAGGVGSLAVQLAKLWGAGRVIATASSEDKRQQVVKLGADVAVDGSPEGLKDRIVEANGGRPVDVVLEMVGGRTFDESFDALARFGRLVTFGAASRESAAAIAPSRLMKGSKTIAGFWLADCFKTPALLGDPLRELFDLTVAGRLRPLVGGEYPLSEVATAHEDLRARRTVGKLVLDPTR